ncbi:MAG: hypothetical protein AB7U46_05085 [Paenirhodobacter sp.]|uniref:hypothetical protein n=1 Tax=Paenirhodobacter sp. TaxID=1965326 RepID=UPI003D13E662
MSIPPPHELIRIIEKHDRQAILDGFEPHQRFLQVVPKVCHELGIVFVIGPHPNAEIEQISGLFHTLYRKKDLAIGSVFSGLASHLDIFYSAYFPHCYGTVRLDAKSCIDATEMQLGRIYNIEEEFKEVLNQIVDVWDIGACLAPFDVFSTPEGDAGEYFRLACNHMEAAAAVACNGARLDGAVMSALLCAELSVKCACLISTKTTKDELRKEVGHNLLKSEKYIKAGSSFDWNDLSTNIAKLPGFTENRYTDKNWTRLECKPILLSAQRLLALVAVGYNKKSIRDLNPI